MLWLLKLTRYLNRSHVDRSEYRLSAIERVIHYIAKNGRPDFHWPDFINHDKSPCTHGRADRFSADAFQHAQIEPIFSDALRCVEVHMRKHSLFTLQSDNLESDTPVALANFLRVKTAGR